MDATVLSRFGFLSFVCEWRCYFTVKLLVFVFIVLGFYTTGIIWRWITGKKPYRVTIFFFFSFFVQFFFFCANVYLILKVVVLVVFLFSFVLVCHEMNVWSELLLKERKKQTVVGRKNQETDRQIDILLY